MCWKQLTLMDLLSSCLSVGCKREEREEEKQRQRLTLLSQSSAVLQGKIKLLSRFGADGTSSAQSVWFSMDSKRGKNSLNCTMIYWQGPCCLTEPYNFPCGCNHSEGDQQGCLDMVLGKRLWVALPEQGAWTRWPPEVPSHLNHSVILWFSQTCTPAIKPTLLCTSTALSTTQQHRVHPVQTPEVWHKLLSQQGTLLWMQAQ